MSAKRIVEALGGGRRPRMTATSYRLAEPLTYREIVLRLNGLEDDEQWRCPCPVDASHELIVAKRHSLLVFEPCEPCEHGRLIAKLRTAGLMRTQP